MFKASNIVPARAYEDAKAEAYRLKIDADNYAVIFALGGNADQIYAVLRLLVMRQGRLTNLAATDGIAEYAAIQENDANYNVAAEFSAMLTALATTIDWISSAIPTSGGYDLMYQRSGTNLVPRDFTAATLGTLVGHLQTLSGMID